MVPLASFKKDELFTVCVCVYVFKGPALTPLKTNEHNLCPEPRTINN
jgi:hypothetical protein